MIFAFGEPQAYTSGNDNCEVVFIAACPNKKFIAVVTAATVYIWHAGLVRKLIGFVYVFLVNA